MSKAMRERRIMAPPVGILTIALLLVVALAGSRFGQTKAQDATPATGSAECVAATGTAPADSASPAAGTPEAAPVGTPVDTATADAAIAAATNFVNCYNAGDVDSLVTLVTPKFLEALTGETDAAAAAAVLGQAASAGLLLSPIAVLSADAETVATYDDGRASIDLGYTQGPYQYVAATWYMVMAGSDLLIDEEVLDGLAPEGDTIIKSASVAADATSVSFSQGGAVTETEVLTIHIINLTGTEDAGYLLYSVPAPVDTGTPLAEGEVAATPTGAEALGGELVGSLVVPAGGEEDLYLLDLPAGTYALVNPLVEGSVATLTVATLDI